MSGSYDAIVVDVSALRIHDSVHISDVAANYPKIEFLDDLDATLATVIPPVVEAVVAPTVEQTAEPELIRKPGAEGEEGEEAPAAGAKAAAPKEEKKEKK